MVGGLIDLCVCVCVCVCVCGVYVRSCRRSGWLCAPGGRWPEGEEETR